MSELKQKLDFVGPKALFDSSYIPLVLLHRDKEEVSLFSILKDSFIDGFSLNILYCGIYGIGKKTLIRKVLQDFSHKKRSKKDLLILNFECESKQLDEILVTILIELNKTLHKTMELKEMIKMERVQLWSSFKLVTMDIKKHIIFLFSDVDELEPEVYIKLLNFCKSLKITTISTMNRKLRELDLRISNYLDLKRELSFYEIQQVSEILKQRVLIAFPAELNNDLIEFITDLMAQHYVLIPGKGIDVLRQIYSIFKKDSQMQLDARNIIEICETEFSRQFISDDFILLSALSDWDFFPLIFLENLMDFFLQSSNYYISLEQLIYRFKISCDMLHYEIDMADFYDYLKQFEMHEFIIESRIILENKDPDKRYFVAVNPEQIRVMIDTIFKTREKNIPT